MDKFKAAIRLKIKLIKARSDSASLYEELKLKRKRNILRQKKLSNDERKKLLKIRAENFKKSGLTIDEVKQNCEQSRKKLLRTEQQILDEYKPPNIS
tara:strand:+ start:295 stop:585 length:291 start_codon:yes stop_codon:yes gene_type:complete